MGVAQLAYEPQLQTITGLTSSPEHVNLLKHVKHSKDAIHIFTVPDCTPSYYHSSVNQTLLME